MTTEAQTAPTAMLPSYRTERETWDALELQGHASEDPSTVGVCIECGRGLFARPVPTCTAR